MKKPWYKRWTAWALIVIVVGILGNLLPDASEDEAVETPAATEPLTQTKSAEELAAEKANEERAAEREAKIAEVQSVSTESTEIKAEPVAVLKQLTKEAVLAKFTIDGNIGPYIDGTFIFTGNRTDTADYYALADTDQYRNASVIFKDDEIARVKFIPEGGTNPADFLAEFGIYEEPRKLSGAAGYYEIALIPLYWSQNIEKYPFELD